MIFVHQTYVRAIRDPERRTIIDQRCCILRFSSWRCRDREVPGQLARVRWQSDGLAIKPVTICPRHLSAETDQPLLLDPEQVLMIRRLIHRC
ncbi:hypothetical protein NPIL_629671 [Nephila pilipes]|uniref:Uncharacterized protein n=1 Tax=Nephila pilipes TaxID=299642 RepID=A0A8X6QCW3_NEPPI|nr:hypothetical protein NPIL_629671 [Nephila pilipes]